MIEEAGRLATNALMAVLRVPGIVLSSKRQPTFKNEIVSCPWEASCTVHADFIWRQIFAIAGLHTWNNLPDAIRDSSLSFLTFTKLLKSYLFV